MAGRIVDSPLERIESVSIIKLLSRLCRRIILQVSFRIRLVSEDGRELASPVAQLHLIMGIVRAYVEEDTAVRLPDNPHVALPEVSMDKAWL